MRYSLSIFFFILIGVTNSFSQVLYFQQEVRYTINVSLDDVRHELNGNETFEYINNSPDELTYIYIHLWANGYKDNTTALSKQLVENGTTSLYFAKDEDRGFIDQLNFKVNNESVKLEYDSLNIDIAKIVLNKPLKHDESITVSTPFHVKIPVGEFSRMGHIDQAYQISQWYPKPAVYDRNGWNQMPYLDQGEFYSEFGTFDVKITLPKNYVVGATGDLVNGEREEKWMTNLSDSTKTITDFGKDMMFPPSDKETKTLHYHQENVHDFAWFADKRYHVLKGEVALPHSQNNVTTWVLFTNFKAKYWMNSIPYIDSAIYYYSLWNGNYPYHQCTAVDGALSAGGGMEYPNVTVIGSVSSSIELEEVMIHEVGHNWFYGILGSNERKHAWMDEGINSFNEFRYMDTMHPLKTKADVESSQGWIEKLLGIPSLDSRSLAYLSYLFNARKNLSQPIDLHSDEFTELNYAGMVYMKTCQIFRHLQNYLGNETFDSCMKSYFDTWKFKHPMPVDIKQVFEKTSGKNLDWFFNDLLLTDKKIDYKICKAKEDKSTNSFTIKVKNNGEMVLPFSISGIRKDSIIKTRWYEGFIGKKTVDFSIGDYDFIKIDAEEDIPEINRRNNTIRTHGIFKKVEPIKLKFLMGFEDAKRTQLYWTPVVGWNEYNKWMPGIALYNTFIPEKNFEFFFAPMYSIGMKSLVGTGKMEYKWHPNQSIFQCVKLGVSSRSYSYLQDFESSADDETFHDFKYIKLQPELSFELKKPYARSPVERKILLREISVLKDILNYNFQEKTFNKEALIYHVIELSYKMNNIRTLDPYSYQANVEGGSGYTKVTGQFNYSFSYNKKNTSADVRFFVGKFIDYHPPVGLDPRLSLSSICGGQDYLFDNTYLGRSVSDGAMARQIYMRDGDFKTVSYVGQTDNWLATVNTEVPLFGAISFIHLFFDAGAYRYTNAITNTHKAVSYDGGFCVSLWKHVVAVYCPLFYSDDIKNTLQINKKDDFVSNIRVELNIDFFNPVNLLKRITF